MDRSNVRSTAALSLVATLASWAHASPAGADNQDLAKQLANPVSDLVSVPFQFNWQNGLGPGGDETRTVLNIQPVVPFTLSSDWNLIGRWIMPYIGQNESLGARSGLGDIVFSSFCAPTGAKSLTWGIGPVVSLPMSSDATLGSGQWSIGPTAIVLKTNGPWVYGVLANQLWSFADATAQQRSSVSQAFVQPFLAYVTPNGITYSLQSESTANWNVTQPSNGPEWRLRVSFVLLLPRTK